MEFSSEFVLFLCWIYSRNDVEKKGGVKNRKCLVDTKKLFDKKTEDCKYNKYIV